MPACPRILLTLTCASRRALEASKMNVERAVERLLNPSLPRPAPPSKLAKRAQSRALGPRADITQKSIDVLFAKKARKN